MKVKLDEGAYMPKRAHELDAGYDLFAPKDFVVPARRPALASGIGTVILEGAARIDTGVHMEIPAGYVGFLKSKSGLNVKSGLTSEGVIDSGYTGSIVVKLYNNSSNDYEIQKGDKISQIVLLPVFTAELELVDELSETERGNGGFGSTGR